MDMTISTQLIMLIKNDINFKAYINILKIKLKLYFSSTKRILKSLNCDFCLANVRFSASFLRHVA